MCKSFQEFEQLFGENVSEDVLTRILEKVYYQRTDADICINEVHKHDALNCTISGTILYNDIEYGFIISDGNNNGTDIIEWGLADDVGYYEPEAPIELILAPFDYPNTIVNDPAKFARYLKLRDDPEIKKILFSYQYDKYFAPSASITKYWTDKAKEKNLQFVEKISEVSNLEERKVLTLSLIGDGAKNIGINLEYNINGNGITTVNTDDWKIWFGQVGIKKDIEEYRFEGNKQQFQNDIIALKMITQ